MEQQKNNGDETTLEKLIKIGDESLKKRKEEISSDIQKVKIKMEETTADIKRGE